MKQLELVNKIQALKLENPDALIRICVDNDELTDDHRWTVHEITRVELAAWIELDDTVYTGEHDAKEAIEEMIYDNNKPLEKETFNSLVDEYFSTHCIDAICVYTNAV